MRVQVRRPRHLEGEIVPPGDKSISHRAAILNAVAVGDAVVRNYSPGGDCASTLRCLRALGVPARRASVDGAEGGGVQVRISGAGASGLHEPRQVLDAGNSGTTLRFLMGLLAGQPFFSTITGDRSLRSRPMDREAVPLRRMGAAIWGRHEGSRAPLAIQGGRLHGIDYEMPEPSAQLKSALLLAGLSAEGETRLRQPSESRDHTERMLTAMGASLQVDGLTLRLVPGPLGAMDIEVPADISSAAFWLVVGVCHPNARIRVRSVGVNPTRAGILEVLRHMGARLSLEWEREEGGEPVADVVAESSRLQGIDIGGDTVPLVIDELPVLALAACFAEGTTTIRDAASLRTKETDRIDTTVTELGRLGAGIRALPDGMVVRGTARLHGAVCRSHGDHRLAMALGVAGLLADDAVEVEGAQAAAVSYPGFWEHLAYLGSGTVAVS